MTNRIPILQFSNHTRIFPLNGFTSRRKTQTSQIRNKPRTILITKTDAVEMIRQNYHYDVDLMIDGGAYMFTSIKPIGGGNDLSDSFNRISELNKSFMTIWHNEFCQTRFKTVADATVHFSLAYFQALIQSQHLKEFPILTFSKTDNSETIQ